MKKTFEILKRLTLIVLAFIVGVSGDVFVANATDLPDAGKTLSGVDGLTTHEDRISRTGDPTGIATETAGRKAVDGLYLSDVDERITKIRPMATPLDQISRFAKTSSCDSFEVKYYSVGTRAISCKLSEGIAEMKTGTCVVLQVDDPTMFTLDDTIRVSGVKAINNEKGSPYTPTDPNTPDLVLCVCGKNENGHPLVYAVNGNMISGQAIGVPELTAGTTLIRMGKACGELDVQTGRFNNIPTPETQYCQNFMIQVEQSTFDKIADKEVNWSFSDVEEDGIYDMRLAMENTWLFGGKNVIAHPTKDGMNTWFTGGIWWQAGNDVEVGEYDTDLKQTVISDDNLVDITKDLFVGTGIGNKRKILLCGSEMLSAFSKIKSDKFRLKDSVEVWNLKFKSWDTDFGEVLTIHHELFDLNKMSDKGLAIDPEYLSKKTHISWARNVLDLQKAGIRRTDAVVIQEVACLYLRYAKAHARLHLKTQA